MIIYFIFLSDIASGYTIHHSRRFYIELEKRYYPRIGHLESLLWQISKHVLTSITEYHCALLKPITAENQAI